MLKKNLTEIRVKGKLKGYRINLSISKVNQYLKLDKDKDLKEQNYFILTSNEYRSLKTDNEKVNKYDVLDMEKNNIMLELDNLKKDNENQKIEANNIMDQLENKKFEIENLKQSIKNKDNDLSNYRKNDILKDDFIRQKDKELSDLNKQLRDSLLTNIVLTQEKEFYKNRSLWSRLTNKQFNKDTALIEAKRFQNK